MLAANPTAVNTKLLGDLAEYAMAHRLMALGYRVSKPLGDNCRYDLIVDIGDPCLRTIQVKTARLRADGTAIDCFSIIGDRYNGIDYIGLYCLETEACYLIPLDVYQSTLRLKDARNGMILSDSLAAEDYALTSEVMASILGSGGVLVSEVKRNVMAAAVESGDYLASLEDSQCLVNGELQCESCQINLQRQCWLSSSRTLKAVEAKTQKESESTRPIDIPAIIEANRNNPEWLAKYQVACEECSNPFISYGRSGRFCGNSCSVKNVARKRRLISIVNLVEELKAHGEFREYGCSKGGQLVCSSCGDPQQISCNKMLSKRAGRQR